MESQLMNLWTVEESTLVQQQQQQQHEHNENEKNVDDDKIRPWVDLPSELLELIFSGLYDPGHISFSSICDQIRFRLTCKRWQSVRCLLGRFPILMSLNPRNGGAFTFFNPITSKEILQVIDHDYNLEFPELVPHIRCSRFGWLLMSRSFLLFFYNPFIPGSIIKLPLSPIIPIERIDSMSFTAPPTSSDCIVYVHDIYNPSQPTGGNKVVIHRWCYGEDHWTDYHIDCQLPFGQSSGNPILYRNAFYQLNKCGRLGISDPKKGNEQHIWKDLTRPKPLKKNTTTTTTSKKRKRKQPKAQEDIIIQSKPPVLKTRTDHYMAECDGKLVMVCVDYEDLFLVRSVHVFELDWTRMEWVTVQSLGNKAMFISEAESLLINTNGGGVENKIYFPAFVYTVDGVVGRATKLFFGGDGRATKKVGVFYCLQNQNYNFSPEYWSTVIMCTWIDTKFQL